MKNLLRALLFVLLAFGSSAQGALYEGEACALPQSGLWDGRGDGTWIAAPANCKGLRYVVVDKLLGPAQGIVTVPDPTCSAKLKTGSDAAAAAGAFAAAYAKNPAFGRVVANLGDLLGKGLGQKMIEQGYPKALSDLFFQKTDAGTCGSVVAIVPPNATVVGIRPMVASLRAGPAVCAIRVDCPTGWAKWLTDPVVEKKDGVQYVYGDFMQWSHDTSQAGRLIVFFSLPDGSPAPIPVM